MRKVVFKDGSHKFFNSRRHAVGEWYQSWRIDKWFIITSVEPGEAVDKYGSVDRGHMHTMREATPEELAERERQESEWQALAPEERTEKHISALSAMFPSLLDWREK